MSEADKAYNQIVSRIIKVGTRKENRTGVDTLSQFGVHYSLDLMDGFPLLTTKEVSWKNILLENLWFLSGSPSLEFLHHYDVHFWDPWLNEHGDIESGYGEEWRAFDGVPEVDQIKNVLAELQRNPMSRRLMVSAWNPATAFQLKLPPCHMTWGLNVQNRYQEQSLNLALFQRSCDVALGLPYNMAGYGFILHLFAHLAKLQVGLFSHTLVDAHIYTASKNGGNAEYDHVPNLKKQIARTKHAAPVLNISKDLKTLDDVLEVIRMRPPLDELLALFCLHGYTSEPPLAFKVAV